MTITVVQSKEFTGLSSGSFSSDVTAGSTVFLWIYMYDGLSTMSSSNPTFNGSPVTGAVKLFEQQSPSGNSIYQAIWMLPDLAGGAASIGISTANGNVDGNNGMAAIEVSGLGASPQADSGASPNPATATGNSSAPASGSTGAITSAPEIILAAASGYAQVLTLPGGAWSGVGIGNSSFGLAGWQVVTSSGGTYSYSPSAGGSASWAAGVVAVQGAAAPAASPAAPPPMPPGLASPAAWQRPRYPRLGQTVTIAGSGGVVLPKPSLSGSGLLTVTGSGGVVLPKPSLSLSGSVAAASGIARPPLMPPGLASPAAWQRPRYRRLPLTATSSGITGSGGVTLPKPSLAASSPPPVTAAPAQGGWWQLHGIITAAAQEREFWDSQEPMACPRCGEPLRPAPPSDSGSSVESYCQFDGFRYPGDWDASTMSGM